MSGWPALRAMRAVRDSKLSGRCRAVLLALILRSDARGICWPSYEKLAEDTGLSRATVRRAIKDLRHNVTSPVRVCIHQSKARGYGRGRGVNVYHLQLLTNATPLQKSTVEIDGVSYDDPPFLE